MMNLVTEQDAMSGMVASLMATRRLTTTGMVSRFMSVQQRCGGAKRMGTV
jgi:hypothetical protein